MSRPLLEVCCADIESVRAAILGGASRIELCSALEVGGLTPSSALIEEAVSLASEAYVAVNILVRPRPGDFVYSPAELRVILGDIVQARRAGVDGVVVGVLTPDGNIDRAAIEAMLQASEGLSVTFHRAIDLCRDLTAECAYLASLSGVDRVLTSGGCPSAEEGIATLRELVEGCRGKLSIMPGAGVTAANAAKIILSTGAGEIHASAKVRVASEMTFRRGDVSMGTPGADEYSRFATSASEVEAIVNSLSSIDLCFND